MPEPADQRAFAVEGERVADQGPGDGRDRDRGDAHHEGVEGVLGADQAGVEEAERRRHHQDERRRGQHPGGIARVDRGGHHLTTGVTAAWSVSPVRMRTACSSGRTKILPSPTSPVRAPSQSASTVVCDERVGDRDLEPDLLREPHLHGGAAVGLDPVELPAVSLHAADREAAHLGPVKGLEHLVRLLGTDNADHEFHNSPLSPKRAHLDWKPARAYPLGKRDCAAPAPSWPRPGPLYNRCPDGDPYSQAAAQAARIPLAQVRDPARRRRRAGRGGRRDRRLLGAQRLQLGAAALEPAAGRRRAAPRRSTPPTAA